MNRPRVRPAAALAALVLLAAPAVADAGLAPVPAAPRGPFGSALERGTPMDPARIVERAFTPAPVRAPEGPRLDGFFFNARLLDVASAGDVDHNGTTDWIRGEAGWSTPLTAAGRVVVTRRSPVSGPVEREILGMTAFENFGASVSSAGDVDGDGYDDIVVGAPHYASTRGRAYVFRGSATGISTLSPWIVEGVGLEDHLGFSVAGAGDVNGDGYDDVLVGSPGASTDAHFNDGRVSCYLGGSLGVSPTPAWTVDGAMTQALMGWCVAGNGDVNADGYADVAITSPGYANGQANEGRVEIFLGGPNGLSTTAAFDYEPDQANWGQDLQATLPGDVDGDGYGDLVIGMPGSDELGLDGGKILVFAGSPFVFFMQQILSQPFGSAGMHYGYDVAPAGDQNGDGFADFLAGAPDYDVSGAWVEFFGASDFGVVESFIPHIGPLDVREGMALAGGGDAGDGKATILAGGPVLVAAPAGGLASSPSPGEVQGAGFVVTVYEGITFDELGYLPARPLAQGNVLDNRSGNALALADVNGDGFSDVIVGSNGYDSGRGKVSAYYGEATGFSIPPFARSPSRGEVAGGIFFQLPDWTYVPPAPDGNFGVSVANAGDVNGDGYEDVIAGAPTHTAGENIEGAAYLFLGGPDGLGLAPAWISEGNASPGYHGYAVGGAGDVNQDGYADLLVGTPLATVNAVPQAGRVQLYYGSANGPAHVPARTFTGTVEGGTLGRACSGIGDVDNDGWPDLAMSENTAAFEGILRVYRGGAAGVVGAPILTWETGLDDSPLDRISPGGDVTGDGYADFLVGSPNYSNGQPDEGAVFLFAGSNLGVGSGPLQTLESNTQDISFGASVWTAGDLNGDGHGDVIVGSPDFPGGAPAPGSLQGVDYPGQVEIFFGTPSGLETGPRLDWEDGDVSFSGGLGFAVVGGGDVNGDGWPDVAFSAPAASTSKLASNGAVHLGFGNVITDGLARPVRTLRTDNVTPIAPGLRSDSPTSFRVQAEARTPAGRGRVRLEWQAKTPLQAFDGSGIGSSNLLRTAVPDPPNGSSIGLGGLVSGFAPGNRVRLRTRFATRHPYFQRSRWITAHGNGLLETDLRTQGPTGFTDVPGPAGVPASLAFLGAAPNPLVAGEGATLRFALPEAGHVTIEAWDAAGRKVADVFDGEREAGAQGIAWRARDTAGRALPRGLYFLRLSTTAGTRVAKVVIAR